MTIQSFKNKINKEVVSITVILTTLGALVTTVVKADNYANDKIDKRIAEHPCIVELKEMTKFSLQQQGYWSDYLKSREENKLINRVMRGE